MKTIFQEDLKLDSSDDLLAIAVSEEGPNSLPKNLNEAFGGHLTTSIGEDDFKGKAGSSLSLRITGQIGAKWLLLVGAGDLSANSYRKAAGAVGSF